MNVIDVILLLPLLYGAFKGFSKGFIFEVATLAGMVLGVFIAIRYSAYTENFLHDFLNITSKYLSYIGYFFSRRDADLCAGESADENCGYGVVGVDKQTPGDFSGGGKVFYHSVCGSAHCRCPG